MTGLVPFGKYKLTSKRDNFGDFYSMLDDFFTDSWYPSRSFIMDNFAIDVNETDKEYQIEAEIPGVKKEEIKIEIDKGKLTISVDRNEEVEEEKKKYVYKERKYSSMQRSVHSGKFCKNPLHFNEEMNCSYFFTKKFNYM